jgi:hypothetical protein
VSAAEAAAADEITRMPASCLHAHCILTCVSASVLGLVSYLVLLWFKRVLLAL